MSSSDFSGSILSMSVVFSVNSRLAIRKTRLGRISRLMAVPLQQPIPCSFQRGFICDIIVPKRTKKIYAEIMMVELSTAFVEMFKKFERPLKRR